MTQFFRILGIAEKASALLESCTLWRLDERDQRHFETAPESFDDVPGSPFAYWVSNAVRKSFRQMQPFENEQGTWVARRGVNSNDDFRFLRCRWEVELEGDRWVKHPKGGSFSPFYADPELVLDWLNDGTYLEVERQTSRVYSHAIVPSKELYFRPGLTWSRRTTSRLSLRAMPSGCVFADKGPAAFVGHDDADELLALLAIANSRAFGILVELQLAAADAAARSYEVGVIQRTPVPRPVGDQLGGFASFARRAWSLKRALDTVTETSHAFLSPSVLRARLSPYDPTAIGTELKRIQDRIDDAAFDLYGFSDADRRAASGVEEEDSIDTDIDVDGENDDVEQTEPVSAGLLSWAAGVAFGRFDWRLATGDREVPGEPEPFDRLPARSPGMLPDGADPFHAHAGILVDDPGHQHDLAHVVEEVLERVDTPVPDDVRRWLQRDFFPFHLQRYSRSRRKAPIYWPLSTPSTSYTLWIYYPSLSSQTLYTGVNDFVEPKLKQLRSEVAGLLNKGVSRSRDDEKQLERLQTIEQELVEMRDALLEIAQDYRPNQDDGVQITAAPLWPLFRHRPWQKVLKDTWTKLDKGDYDWAHLAMDYWPDRVREKCKTDKSLAIAHDLEELYVESKAPKKQRKWAPT